MRSAIGTLMGLAIVTLLGGIGYLAYLQDICVANDRVSTGSRIAATPCGPIEYATAGDGPPVVIVHGAGGGFDQGMEIGAPFAERGYRIIAMSRFGYLRTPLPENASAAAQADAVLSINSNDGHGRMLA